MSNEDVTRKQRHAIEAGWLALYYACETTATSLHNEIDDCLKYETGSKTAGRPRVYAKALMVEAYVHGRYGNTQDRRVWLGDALGISRGIRFAYMLGCYGRLRTDHIRNYDDRIKGAVVAWSEHCKHPLRWPYADVK